MSGRTRLGVVGVGSLGFHHARILSQMSAIELVGVHDSRPERLTEVGEQLGIATFPDMAELAGRCDAVVVAVPTTAHERVAVAIVEQGAHVLVEKPIAPDLEAADRILEAASRAGRIVQIGHVERFNPIIRACEPYIEDPLFIESHRLAPFGIRGTDVAVVLDLMIHDLDLVLSFMPRPVSSFSAVGVPVLADSPDIANARIEFENGAVADLTASRVSMERMRKIRFFQRSGYISLDLAAGKGEFLRLREGARANPGERLSSATSLMDIIERVPLVGDGAEPLKSELESFVAAVEGRGATAVSGEDGRRALAVALQIVDRIQQHVAHSRTS
ncbi:MAG TPA: Gfo/Idh/MocA family oxidoreductase [Longimicrobiales bacterium]|nr:Gfo/Idh/MocA family oxidoreductase [Longimicrobiales bacterium]